MSIPRRGATVRGVRCEDRPRRPAAPAQLADRRLTLLADGRHPLQDLCDDVIYSLRDSPRPGDAVLALARTHAFPPGQTATWEFGPQPEDAGRARARVRRKLTAWTVDQETAAAWPWLALLITLSAACAPGRRVTA